MPENMQMALKSAFRAFPFPRLLLFSVEIRTEHNTHWKVDVYLSTHAWCRSYAVEWSTSAAAAAVELERLLQSVHSTESNSLTSSPYCTKES